MKLVYIAGKYTDKTFAGVDRNIKIADALGMQVVKRFGKVGQGVMVMIPHNNTPLHWEGAQDGQWFYDATMELLKRCDACIYVPGDNSPHISPGTANEIKYCLDNGKPAFSGDETGLHAFARWLDGTPECNNCGGDPYWQPCDECGR